MTDEELISILVDTEAGLGPTEGYGPAIEHVRALIAQRDRLKSPWDDLGAQYGCPDCGVHANCASVVEERERWKTVARVMEATRDRMREERDRLLRVAEQITITGETFRLGDNVDMPALTVEEAFARVTAAARRAQWEVLQEQDQATPSKWRPADRRVIPDEELIAQQWYAVPDVLIGGWCVINTDKPDNGDVDVDVEERQLGDFLSRAIAEHVVLLHNSWLAVDVTGGPAVPAGRARVPKYVQIEIDLRNQIAKGNLAPGDPVPSERDLAEYWQCARMTAKQALDVLRRDGVIFSRQGSGTFVSAP